MQVDIGGLKRLAEAALEDEHRICSDPSCMMHAEPGRKWCCNCEPVASLPSPAPLQAEQVLEQAAQAIETEMGVSRNSLFRSGMKISAIVVRAWLESDEGKAAIAASLARSKAATDALNKARKVTSADLSEPYFAQAAPQAAVPSEREKK